MSAHLSFLTFFFPFVLGFIHGVSQRFPVEPFDKVVQTGVWLSMNAGG